MFQTNRRKFLEFAAAVFGAVALSTSVFSQSAETEALQAPEPAEANAQVDNPAAKYLPEVVMDEFNPDVTNAMRADPKPRRGGVLKVRTPADYQHLNPITSTGAPERTVQLHLFDTLIDQDRATLEYYPEQAWYWRETDLLKKKDGEVREGRILDVDADPVTFVPGAWRATFSREDVAEYDVEEGYLVLVDERGGKRIEGEIKLFPETIRIDEGKAANAKREVIAVADLDRYTYQIGDVEEDRPFAKKNCAFEFYIRPGISWHDGKPFTAEDVLFGYETIMNPGVDTQHLRNYYQDVVLAETFDEGMAIRYHYRKPYFAALDSLGGGLYAIPKHVFSPEKFGGDEKAFAEAFNSHNYREAPIGTGPYKLKEYKRGAYLTLGRNEEYWKNDLPEGSQPYFKKGQPWLDEITWVVIEDKAASLKELQKGAIHVDFDVEPEMWVRDATNSDSFTSKFVRAHRVGFLYTYIGWNLNRPWFQDKDVRRALAMLIPRQKIADEIHQGVAFPVNGPFYVNGPGYNHDVDPIEYDPRSARRLLARAGWLDRDRDGVLEKEIDGEMVLFEFGYYIHNARDYHQKIADIIKEQLEQAKLKVEIRKLDWTIFADTVRDKKFDAVRFAWGASLEPDPFQIWHSSQIENKGDNFVSYSNDRVDELCVKIRETFDPEKRWEMAREMHQIIYNDQPYSFLFGFDENYFIDRGLRGVRLYPNLYPYDLSEWWWSPGGSLAGGKAQ